MILCWIKGISCLTSFLCLPRPAAESLLSRGPGISLKNLPWKGGPKDTNFQWEKSASFFLTCWWSRQMFARRWCEFNLRKQKTSTEGSGSLLPLIHVTWQLFFQSRRSTAGNCCVHLIPSLGADDPGFPVGLPRLRLDRSDAKCLCCRWNQDTPPAGSPATTRTR